MWTWLAYGLSYCEAQTCWEPQDSRWTSENTEINLIKQKDESTAVMSCEFAFVMTWACFFSWSDRRSAVCRGSRGKYGVSVAAERRCFSHHRAIDKQPIDATYHFSTYAGRMQRLWFTSTTKTDGCLRRRRAMFQNDAAWRKLTEPAFEIVATELFPASLVIRATRASTAESLGTFPPLWSRFWLSAQGSTCRHEEGLTFLLELCARLFRRIRMHASVFREAYDAVTSRGTACPRRQQDSVDVDKSPIEVAKHVSIILDAQEALRYASASPTTEVLLQLLHLPYFSTV